MRSILSLVLVSFIAVVAACKESAPAAADKPAHGAMPTATAAAAPADTKCEHGVQKDICARCNPGLKAAFVAKNDWCAEHERPESQCAICHSNLAAAGIKP